MTAPVDVRRHLAEGWVSAVNKPGERVAWITRAFSQSAMRAVPMERRLRLLQDAATASGGLELLDVRTGADEYHPVVRTRRGAMVRAARFTLARDQPARLYAAAETRHPMPPFRAAEAKPLQHRDLRQVIQARIAHAVAADDFSGVVRVTTPTGSVLHQSAHGWADRDQDVRVTAEHRFHMGSADKSFTALLIARLVTAGQLSFDSLVGDLLPAYANRDAAGKITVRHLLTHTSGLGDLWSRPGWDGRRRFSRVSDILPIFWRNEPAFEPGSRAAYSNEGFILLGAIIEAVSQGTWWDELARHIHRPAGMRQAAHYTLDGPAPRRAVGYMYREGDGLGLCGRTSNWSVIDWRGNSCGGGYATAQDVTNYLRALQGGRLCSREQATLIVAQAAPGLRDYGMGFQRRTASGRTLIGHAGGGPFHGVNIDDGVVWETGWAYAVMGNYNAPFAQYLGADIGRLLAAQPG